jgi:hypothetical protein
MERDVNWTHLAQTLDGSGALVIAVMNQWVPYNVGNCRRLVQEVFVLKTGFTN